MNLGTAVELAAHRFPAASAIVTEKQRLTYREWDQRINSVAHGLIHAGIRPGDHVAVCTGNGEAAATTYFAIHKAGAVAVMLNTRWKKQDFIYAFREADIKAVLYDKAGRDEVRQAILACENSLVCIYDTQGQVNDDEGEFLYEKLAGNPTSGAPACPRRESGVSTILYTSGTTGEPKGVCRSCRSDYYSALAIILEHRWGRFERVLAVMPLYHTMGLHTLISMVLLNGTAVLLPRANPEECYPFLASESVSALYLVPTIFHDFVEFIAGSNPGTLRVKKLAFAGAPMTAGLIKRCREVFQPEVFVNQYGCTEMLAISINSSLDKKPLSAGRPALHSRLRIVAGHRNRTVHPEEMVPRGETGEVILDFSSPQAFLGYLSKPDVTRQVVREGWYFTGDLGFFDSDGDLQLMGRVDDMIISGGENIYPGEVEKILREYSQVKDAVVLGLPDKRWGEIVTACIVPATAGLTIHELERFCVEHPGLARYKRPRRFIFLGAIPRSPTGKVSRRRLKELIKTLGQHM